MSDRTDQREAITTALHGFSARPLADAATALLGPGLRKQEAPQAAPNTGEKFLGSLPKAKRSTKTGAHGQVAIG